MQAALVIIKDEIVKLEHQRKAYLERKAKLPELIDRAKKAQDEAKSISLSREYFADTTEDYAFRDSFAVFLSAVERVEIGAWTVFGCHYSPLTSVIRVLDDSNTERTSDKSYYDYLLIACQHFKNPGVESILLTIRKNFQRS